MDGVYTRGQAGEVVAGMFLGTRIARYLIVIYRVESSIGFSKEVYDGDVRDSNVFRFQVW